MKVRLLYTDGSGKFIETAWDKPDITEDEIEVKAVMTGICRSDIDMMQGNFGPLPLHMQGHEGLGKVTRVGENIEDVKVGDYVATRGEPAFADYYNVRADEYVKVPKAEAKYILEPVACAVNLITQQESLIRTYTYTGNNRLLILGSGFLAWIAFQTLIAKNLDFDITVVGNSNRDRWSEYLELADKPTGKYDVIIDLKNDDTVFAQDIINENGLIILASEKHPTVTTTFGNLLWKAVTIICPSPRHYNFYSAMEYAATWIAEGTIKVDDIWTCGYDRDKEWQQAFADGLNRPQGYNRGYLKWR
jgi:D-arabinose 1-dehydrogenase-like Zn-dependent alcohol dehydrogenase